MSDPIRIHRYLDEIEATAQVAIDDPTQPLNAPWLVSVVREVRAALSTTPAPLDVEPARHPIWEEVADELHRAQSQHGPMASGHEAQSVIGEEFHEFTLAVWFGVDQKGRPADPRAEAVQIAAMAVRYILDVADQEGAA